MKNYLKFTNIFLYRSVDNSLTHYENSRKKDSGKSISLLQYLIIQNTNTSVKSENFSAKIMSLLNVKRCYILHINVKEGIGSRRELLKKKKL